MSFIAVRLNSAMLQTNQKVLELLRSQHPQLQNLRLLSGALNSRPAHSAQQQNITLDVWRVHQPTVTCKRCIANTHQLHRANASSPYPREDAGTRAQKEGREKQSSYMSNSEKNAKVDFKEMGIHMESPGSVFSNYVPFEKKAPFFLPLGAKQRWEAFRAFLSSTYSFYKIRKKIDFETGTFAREAQKQFIDVNKALQLDNSKVADRIIEEKMVSVLAHRLKSRFRNPANRVYWRFGRELSRPRIVHARVGAGDDTKEVAWAQVTVRLHSQQLIAQTDRYDRLIGGSKKVPKEMLDFIVLERHLADPYSHWRIAGKLEPRGVPRDSLTRKLVNRLPDKGAKKLTETEKNAQRRVLDDGTKSLL